MSEITYEQAVAQALERARKGDAFLIERLGADYWKRIEPETLDMLDCNKDVVGQSTGNDFVLQTREWELSSASACDLGLDTLQHNGNGYIILRDARLILLAEKREMVGQGGTDG